MNNAVRMNPEHNMGEGYVKVMWDHPWGKKQTKFKKKKLWKNSYTHEHIESSLFLNSASMVEFSITYSNDNKKFQQL